MNFLKEVRDLQKMDLRPYAALDPRTNAALVRASAVTQGQRVLHISATAQGGGVSELLRSQVRVERALGLKSSWYVVRAPEDFFVITKKIHNLLQGKRGALSSREKRFYLDVTRRVGSDLRSVLSSSKGSVLMVHDAQPLPAIAELEDSQRAVLRLHVDLLTPNRNMLKFLEPYIARCDRVVVSVKDYIRALSVPRRRIKIIAPTIDPFSEKNREMKQETAAQIVGEFGINVARPIVTQVSRFDPWKDPLGVILAYYYAKNKIPELQLVLAGFQFAQDDPEAAQVFTHVKKHARGDHDIHLFSDPRELEKIANDTFINALYTSSTVIMQKSVREGFGLTVTEAMWKGKAVIAGRTSGTRAQIVHGRSGLLVGSPQAAGRALIRLLGNESLRKKLGRAAHKSVSRNFLILRSALLHMRMYRALMHR